MVGLQCRHYDNVNRTIHVVGHEANSTKKYSASNANRPICVAGDTPHDPKIWRAKQRGMKDPSLPAVISIHGGKARDRSVNRTIMVVGDTPRDPGAERCKYRPDRTITVCGEGARVYATEPRTDKETPYVDRDTFPVAEARIAMGIEWMTMAELSQAIPPAYTQYIGEQLRRFV